MDAFGPSTIRQLRGGLSPAELAARVGVSELTVRRWELPDEHPEARRPRKASRARLEAMATAREAPVVPPWVAVADRGRLVQARDAALGAAADTDPAWVRAILALEALVGRADVLGARAALVDPPPDSVAGGRLHALAALLHASRDGRVHDPARALDHADRAGRDPEAAALADLARAQAHHALGDLPAAIAAYESAAGVGALTRCLCAEGRARAELLRGRPERAAVLFRAVAERARALGLAQVEARARATRGLLSLLAAEDPADALSQAERARNALRETRAVASAVDVDVAGTLAEALLRLGRNADARVTLEGAEVVAERIRWPADALVPARLRVALHGGPRPPPPRIPGPAGPAVDAILDAAAALDDPRLAAVRAEAAARLARQSGLPVLEAWALALAATLGAPGVLAALERLLDRFPMPWFDAIAAPARAAALARDGRGREATWTLEAAVALLERAADRPELARARLALALVRGEATPTLAARAELSALGLEPVGVWFPEIDRAPGVAAATGRIGLVHRVGLRGVPPERIERELVTGAVRVLGPRVPVELVEIDPAGREWQLARRGPTELGAPTFERALRDGTGRRLVFRAGPVGAVEREILEAGCAVAELALELAVCRAGVPSADTDAARLAPLPDPVLVLAPADRDLGGLIRVLHADRAGPIVVHPGPELGDALVRAAGGTLVLRDLAALDPDAQEVLARILRESDAPARVIAITGTPGLVRPDLYRAVCAEVLVP